MEHNSYYETDDIINEIIGDNRLNRNQICSSFLLVEIEELCMFQ